MKKRILSLIVMVSILSSLMVTFSITTSAATEGIYTYYVSNGVATITDCSEYASGNIIIPDTLGGCPVTVIDNYAFQRCYSLTSVKIPEGVVKIGYYAFDYCEKLEIVEIPASVTTILHDVFERCYNLKSINVCENNANYCSIDGNLFDISKTTLINYAIGKDNVSYDVPDGVTNISRKAFQNGENLTSITISDSVIQIGLQAFSGCTKLENIRIGKNVETIEDGAFNGCWGIKSIEIPDKVIKIGEWAFAGCNFKSITIPDSVTHLGENAFTNCSQLEFVELGSNVELNSKVFDNTAKLTHISVSELNPNYCSIDGVLFNKSKTIVIKYPRCKSDISYEIPNSVVVIDNGAFSDCQNLTNIKISNKVTSISENAFSSCFKLTSIIIPNNVVSIETYAFKNCRYLTNVKIPNTVTQIGFCAFSSCYNLEDVYYGGTEEEWSNINIINGNDELIEANIHYNAFRTPSQGYNETECITGTFQFASEFGNKQGDNGNSIASYVYDDNYFSNSSMNNYNHDLSKMSLRLAMSAFAVHGSGSDKYKYQDVNAKALLTELGFDEIEDIGYSEKPSTNSIGVIAANKRIAFEDDDYTLIAVAVRGNGYESEWGGNFNVGTGEEHKGFKMARDQVLSFLTNYVRNADISGNVKIWITGFSRAAATTNLTAAYLDTHSLALNGTNTDPTKIIEVKPENIYAYCFETPAGTRAADKNNEKYNNIFSIVNQNDFVPMVAPEKWNYGRYGITYYLPTARTNSDFKSLVGNMYTYFDEYAGHDYVSWRAPVIEQFDNYKISWSLDHAYPYYGFYLKEKNSKQTMDDFLQNVIDNLATTFKSPEYYNEHLEDALVFFGTEIMGQEKADKFGEIFVDELMSRLNPFKSLFEGIDKLTQGEKIGLLRSTVKGTFKRMSINISDEAFDGLVELFSYLLNNGSLETLLGNLNILPNVHFPELCLAWLDSTQPSKYLRNTRKMCLNCPVDIEVYDSNNNLVAAIRNNEVIDIEDSSIVAYVDENGQKVIYLPTDEEYRTEIIATDDGEVTYSVQEQNVDTGEIRVINYNKMTMKKDDTLTGTAENLNETEIATYTLTSNSVTVEEPEVIENALPVAITPVAEGNGNASGGGSLLKGEYAQLTATPFENETFIGWYNGETLVTNEATYRFQVAEETTLTAKFTENTCEILYLTDDEDVVVIDRILKGSTVTFLSMTQNPNYMIMGIYTDKEFNTHADESAAYSQDAILYAKVLTKDEWVQFDEVNNKLVVYTSTAMNDVQLLVALYEKEKLTELKPSTVDLVVGKNEFENLIANMETADTLKIFVWDGLSSLKPIYKNCVVDLK